MTSSTSGAEEKVTDVKVVQVSSVEDTTRVPAEPDKSSDNVAASAYEEFQQQLASFRAVYILPKSLNVPLGPVWTGKAVAKDDNTCADAARTEKVVQDSSVEAIAQGLAEIDRLLPEEKFSELILWKPRRRSVLEQTSEIRMIPEPIRYDAIIGEHFGQRPPEPPPRRATAADFGVKEQDKVRRTHWRGMGGKSLCR